MDDVLLEVRTVREGYAKRFAYDLLAIHRDLKEQEQASGRRIVCLPPRRPHPAPPRTPKGTLSALWNTSLVTRARNRQNVDVTDGR